MAETLLTSSSIKMYGRILNDLQYSYDPATVVQGFNNFLQNQLAADQNQVIVIGNTPANGANVTVTSSLGGISPGMTVSATANGNAVFATGTSINTISATSFSVANGSSVTQTATGVPITATGTGAASKPNPAQSPYFARIYAFSFEGAIYNLPRPSIFLVHGFGTRITVAANRSPMDQAGVAAREWEFSGEEQDSKGNPDFRYWEYEKG